MTEITQADRDVAETLFNDVLGNVSSYGEWGYMSYRQAAERSMAAAFARHRQQAAAEERAKIVEWLRNVPRGLSLTATLNAIEAGEHAALQETER